MPRKEWKRWPTHWPNISLIRRRGRTRTDNIFETMLDAGVTGSMGGAQFVPVIGGSKLYDSKRKKNITNNYKASSETAKRILGEDMDKI